MSGFTDWDVTEAMIRCGGSFVSGLGRLYRQADPANKRKLRAAFPDYFRQYLELAMTGKITHSAVAGDAPQEPTRNG